MGVLSTPQPCVKCYGRHASTTRVVLTTASCPAVQIRFCRYLGIRTKMLFRLLFLIVSVYFAQGASVGNPEILTSTNKTASFSFVDSDAQPSCTDNQICRTRYNIIWSSLVTILACVWTAVHRNIPGPAKAKESRMRYVIVRVLEVVKIVAVTLLVPEWVLAWAVRQFLNAREVGRELEQARASAKDEWDRKREFLQAMERNVVDGSAGRTPASNEGTIWGEETLGSDEQTVGGEEENLVGEARPAATGGSGEKSRDYRAFYESTMAVDERTGRLDCTWTTWHGFFVIMGGFHYYDNGKPKHPLSPEDVVRLVKAGDLVPPTEDEIRGWSQGDVLSKALAVVQTLWFIAQCIARSVEGLPITQLEVMTLAYTTITVAMYAFWWNKPQNVGSAVRVALPGKRLPRGRPVEEEPWSWRSVYFVGGWQDVFVDLREEPYVPTFYSGGTTNDSNDYNADIFALSASVVFGAVHCAAWDYAFPSRAEKHIWRITAVAIAALPGVLLLIFLSSLGMGRRRHVIVSIFFPLDFFLACFIYFGARLLLI
ncbi:hypothetical protein BV25DRAFT_1851027, partial [Artomyces pyxidatus]